MPTAASGLFALTLARHFERVAGVEVSETSCEWARNNAVSNHIANADVSNRLGGGDLRAKSTFPRPRPRW